MEASPVFLFSLLHGDKRMGGNDHARGGGGACHRFAAWGTDELHRLEGSRVQANTDRQDRLRLMLTTYLPTWPLPRGVTLTAVVYSFPTYCHFGITSHIRCRLTLDRPRRARTGYGWRTGEVQYRLLLDIAYHATNTDSLARPCYSLRCSAPVNGGGDEQGE